jgi:hypothetical protein
MAAPVEFREVSLDVAVGKGVVRFTYQESTISVVEIT